MINKANILTVLKMVVDTIDTDYDNQNDCKEAIIEMVNKVNLLRSQIEMKPIHTYYKTVLECLVLPQGKKYTKIN